MRGWETMVAKAGVAEEVAMRLGMVSVKRNSP